MDHDQSSAFVTGSSEPTQPIQDTQDTPAYPSPEERLASLQASLEEDLDALIGELSEGPSERLQRLLEFSARFYHYSPTNQMLIAMQYPTATRVAGYKAWEAMGYHVRSGEKGIKILVPITTKRTEIDPQTGQERVIEGAARAFTTGAVFDISQIREDELAARPLPEFFEALGDDPFHLAERVAQVIVEDGISIEEDPQSRAVGYSRGGVIGVRAGLDETTLAQTLIHEYAHEKTHQGESGRSILPEVREMHAEAVTYVVCRHFGLPVPVSADYLRLYGATPKAVLGEMRAILLCSSRIIEAIHRLDQEMDEGLDEQEKRGGRHTSRLG